MDDGELVTKGYLKQEFKREFDTFEKKMDKKFEHYFSIMMEKMNDNNRMIMEIIIPMKEQTDRIPKIEEDIADIKTELHTMQSVLKVTNADVSDHERRIARLELQTY